MKNGYLILLSPLVSGTLFFCILLFIYGGWHIGGSFDEQSIKLEAILKKLGFHKPSRMDLQDFALNDLSLKNKEDNKDYGHERWKDYTYRIDLAKQYDEEKYGKNDIKSRSNH